MVLKMLVRIMIQTGTTSMMVRQRELTPIKTLLKLKTMMRLQSGEQRLKSKQATTSISVSMKLVVCRPVYSIFRQLKVSTTLMTMAI